MTKYQDGARDPVLLCTLYAASVERRTHSEALTTGPEIWHCDEDEERTQHYNDGQYQQIWLGWSESSLRSPITVAHLAICQRPPF